MPSALVDASKPWSISMGMPCVPSRFMLKPQANSPSAICQNGTEASASLALTVDGARAAGRACAPAGRSTIWCGSRSVCAGAWSRITNSAEGTVTSANSAAKPSMVSRQPTAAIA